MRSDRASCCYWDLDIVENLVDRLQRRLQWEEGGCLFAWRGYGGYGSFGSSHWVHAVRAGSVGTLQA